MCVDFILATHTHTHLNAHYCLFVLCESARVVSSRVCFFVLFLSEFQTHTKHECVWCFSFPFLCRHLLTSLLFIIIYLFGITPFFWFKFEFVYKFWYFLSVIRGKKSQHFILSSRPAILHDCSCSFSLFLF